MRLPSTLTSLLVIATCSLPAVGGHPGQDAPKGIDPEAGKILERMGAFYESTDAATFKTTMELSDPGMPAPMSFSTSMAIGRPNLLTTRGLGDSDTQGSIRASCDGTTLTVAVPEFEMYSSHSAPASFKPLVDGSFGNRLADEDAPEVILAQDPSVIVALSLFVDNPATRLMKGLDSITLEGEETFNGTPATKLKLSGADESNPFANSTLWIDKGATPWLLGLQPELGDQGTGDRQLKILLTFADWKTGAPRDGYGMRIDDDWKKVDNLMESAMAAAMEQMQGPGGQLEVDADQPAPDHPTIGKAAPDFTLKTLADSREVSLSSLKGKVVVLDFWATWCAPCIAGLPTMDEVTGRFKDRGVEFFAVDLREGTERVQKFMDGKKWDFTVLMDEQGGVAREFGVGGIPHSVLIDREGVIRHVHIGFGGKDELERQLTEELTGLVGDAGDGT